VSGENEAPLPGPSTARNLLEAMRDAAVNAPPAPAKTRITIKGEPQVVETMLPGIREAFYPKDALIIGEGKFHTVSWHLDGPIWTLTVELIEASL
jgi:hypothetical protein